MQGLFYVNIQIRTIRLLNVTIESGDIMKIVYMMVKGGSGIHESESG